MYYTFDKRKWKNPPFFLFLDRFKITMVLLTVIVITAGIVLASAFQAKGNSNSRYKYYKSVEINPEILCGRLREIISPMNTRPWMPILMR